MTGFVYAMQAENGLYKIGWSADPIRRLAKVQADTASPCRLVGTVPATLAQEGVLLALLQAYRSHASWFHPASPVLRFVNMLRRPRPVVVASNPIEHIRKKVFGVTQTVFAAIAGTAQASVSRWERGELFPDRENMRLIREEAARLGKPWDDRWFFEVPPTAPIPADLEHDGAAA